MLTSIGRFLRKLRIDQGEILKDMAEKLGVTVSFLSAVENGKKKMPSVWNKKICDLYNLSAGQRDAFTAAIADTEDSIEMNLYEATVGRRELAVSFARKFSEIDDFQAEEIKKFYKVVSAKNELLQGICNFPKEYSGFYPPLEENGASGERDVFSGRAVLGKYSPYPDS